MEKKISQFLKKLLKYFLILDQSYSMTNIMKNFDMLDYLELRLVFILDLITIRKGDSFVKATFKFFSSPLVLLN